MRVRDCTTRILLRQTNVMCFLHACKVNRITLYRDVAVRIRYTFHHNVTRVNRMKLPA